MFALQKILGLTIFGSSGITTDFIPSSPITSTGGGSISASSNVGNFITTSNKSITRKLDQVIDAINNFTPVYTQVIDLPTLSRANKIGGSMILQGV